MKKSKLNIEDLKVQSFVIDLNNSRTLTVIGGVSFVNCSVAPRTTPCNECKEGS